MNPVDPSEPMTSVEKGTEEVVEIEWRKRFSPRRAQPQGKEKKRHRALESPRSPQNGLHESRKLPREL